MKNELNFSLGFIISAFLLISLASGACPVAGCGSGDESWTESTQSFINSDIPIVGLAQSMNDSSFTTSFNAGKTANKSSNSAPTNAVMNSVENPVQSGPRQDPFPDSSLLKPMQGIGKDELMLDVSARRSGGESRIKGAVLLPWKSLTYENGSLRSPPELASILGSYGISEDDELVVYSDSFSSGEATFVLWALSLLGHEKAKALDGGLEDWTRASQPLEIESINRSATTYMPNPRPELLSDYQFVKSGDAQIVDARAFQDFGESKITDAIFIDPQRLVVNGRLKEAGELKTTFAILNASQPVVVYSDDLLNSSIAWYALQLMGFDSRVYSPQDWQASEALE